MAKVVISHNDFYKLYDLVNYPEKFNEKFTCLRRRENIITGDITLTFANEQYMIWFLLRWS